MFRKYGIVSLVMYDLFLFNYFTMLPDIAWMALVVQLCLVTPTGICEFGIPANAAVAILARGIPGRYSPA